MSASDFEDMEHFLARLYFFAVSVVANMSNIVVVHCVFMYISKAGYLVNNLTMFHSLALTLAKFGRLF
jgi:hypothetical protein